jgi:RimJ/RimL family protein N-acetyltransferase
MTSVDWQPAIGNRLVQLRPLRAADFAALYAVAADPLVWEQHPNRDRYRRDVFEKWFEGALSSGGALLVVDALSQELIGSSRYYEHDPIARTVLIGYTFLARSHWGRGYNPALKVLMLDHAFRHVDRVIFHVGERNRRSRIAMERLGGVLRGSLPVVYYGESATVNVVYTIDRADWLRRPHPVDTRSADGPAADG